MTILTHIFGAAEVTPIMLDNKIDELRAEMKATHEQAAEVKARLLAPAMLSDEQHAADETALAAATRTAGRLTDAVRQLEEARPAVVEAEAKRQGEAARAAFRRDVDAVTARSAALSARIQADYPAAAATLASLFTEAHTIRRDMGTLTLRGKALGLPMDAPDPEDFRHSAGQFRANLDAQVMLPGLMVGDAFIYPKA